jgi:predicted N-formylglutamate amidohydrolase
VSRAPRDQATTGLLEPTEPAAFELVNAEATSSAVLVCDHAANRVPRRLGTLGLTPEQLADHIAWDPGAQAVARRLARLLDATLILSGYSRLVIDCNRPLGHPTSIAPLSAGVPIPGNVGLSAEACAARAATLFQPYHDAIDRLIRTRAHRPCCLLSIHSFTPVLDGRARPWVVGVSPWGDARLATLMRGALARRVDGPIGDNEPYPISTAVDYTIPVHSDAHQVPALMIEIRNDGLRTPAATDAWADHLAAAYREIECAALAHDLSGEFRRR